MRKLAILFAALLAGCQTISVSDSSDPKELYQSAISKLEHKQTRPAIEELESIMGQFPFGAWAEKAHLAQIYAHYNLGEYAEASATAERFIELYPRHRFVDYAYYMRGLVEYYAALGFAERFLPLRRAERDITPAVDAFFHFAELVERYPYSRYSQDATKRMLFLREMIGQHHLNIMKYYDKREMHIAAINRGHTILSELPMTKAARDARDMLVANYNEIGEEQIAQSFMES